MSKLVATVAARHLKKAYMVGVPTHVHAAQTILTVTLATLRALRWMHWSAHWTAKGQSSYGDHQLFERMYNQMTGEIDQLAEKCVGLFGPDSVSPFSQIDKAQAHISRFKEVECPYLRALAGEEDLQVTIRTAYDLLKGMDSLSLGMDDYLMTLANQHEVFIYLLQQRMTDSEGRPGIEKPPYDFSLVGEPIGDNE